MIIAGYLAIAKRQRKNASAQGYYFSDSPKTDVNGLIAATRESIEEAVDQAVDKVKDVATGVAETLHVDEAVNRVKEIAGNVADAVHVDDAIATAKDVVGGAKHQGDEAIGRLRDTMSSTLGGNTQDKPVRAISNAVAQDTSALNTNVRPKIEGAEWASQTRKTNDQ